MIQTGHRPPINIQADKGTNQHRTRQFTSIVTVVPDSPNLLTFVFLGQPVVLRHDGEGISECIIDELEKWKIKPEQCEGGSFDGQYFHLNVPSHLKEKFNLSRVFMCTWDPLHKGGVADSHIRNDSTFKWLLDIQTICRDIYTLFNRGKNYEELVKACEILDIEHRKLTNFQTTRFANSVRFVFINLREDYPAIRMCMTKVMKAKEISSNPNDRAKASSIKNTICNINSWMFCLCLSGCADIYEIFGEFAQVCQEVDILPYERYDKANAVLDKFARMLKTLEHEECLTATDVEDDEKKCLWKRYHKDKKSIEKDENYVGVKIDNIHMSTCRQTRLRSSSDQLQIADGTSLIKERLKTLVWRLHHDLRNEVFEKDTVTMIENIRTICDLKTMLVNIQKKGVVFYGLENSKLFVTAVRSVTETIDHIDDEELMKSYRIFVKKLDNHFSKTPIKNIDSKDMIKAFLKKELKLYEDVAVIVNCITVAVVKISVESVVESLVSRYSNHISPMRQATSEINSFKGNDYKRKWASSTACRLDH